MSQTYSATGINLKTMPLGEADRLLTVLTREHGLIQAVAPGSRKTKSSLSGRSGLFVVNRLFLVKGRSLDKITQAETLESYPGLAQDLCKLTASQYLAELVLYQALSHQPQEELFCLLTEHLSRLEAAASRLGNQVAGLPTLALLVHGTFHLLALAGIAPHVQVCCVTRGPVVPNFTNPNWRIGFSMAAGGIISLSAPTTVASRSGLLHPADPPSIPNLVSGDSRAESPGKRESKPAVRADFRLRAAELAILQRLAEPSPLDLDELGLTASQLFLSGQTWLAVERVLRQHAQYQFDRPIRSASLVETCFSGLATFPHSPKS
ncbi:DNA repair protein RecO [Leptolyngbya sp. 'hensonii']|uniref:DNA repair protein RecO n=1 Tax=Leptolyngbya sp. 'hensonii' TaxID=1922337 RepID=UPI00094FC8AF|nr:DNA repair protein RecO [Leptolyngbya sp. 'hensonii']OLP16092.1 DNA repair protein RecO [Leptolyngbya sp. 'hensonii']